MARLTFSGAVTEFASLMDGRYSLTILGNKIQTGGVFLDGDGNGTAGGNRVDSFFRLFGDANGDGSVNQIDYAALQLALVPGHYNPAFDFRNDGKIDDADLAEFRRRMRS